MPSNLRARPLQCFRRLPASLLPSSALVVLLSLITGCSLSPLAKHTAAFSSASTLVIDSSESAYLAANQLHHDVLVASAVTDYDKNISWNPYTDPRPLLTPAQLNARLKVLDGLKAYAASLVALTPAKTPAALNTAAAGIGSNLKALNTTVASDLSTAMPGAPVMSADAAKGVSIAVSELGQFLIDRKTRQSLKQVTHDMNPNVIALCKLLDSDIVVLRSQADVDYQTLITSDDQLIRHTTVDVFQHRDQVGILIDLAAKQKANDALLVKLQTALHTLDLTHQALAAAAQGNDPETIKQKLVDLAAAGQDLATFYKSLPAS